MKDIKKTLLALTLITFLLLIVPKIINARVLNEGDQNQRQENETQIYLHEREKAKQLEEKQKTESLSYDEKKRLEEAKNAVDDYTDTRQALADYDRLIRKDNRTPEEQARLEQADRIRRLYEKGQQTSPTIPSSVTNNPGSDYSRGETACTFDAKSRPYYCMLAPVSIFTSDSLGRVLISPDGFTTFLNNLVRFAISIATGLAVIMIVLGGVQYASTDAIYDKSEGKARIQQALSGLVLALLSYLILSTINKEVFDTKLDIRVVGSKGEEFFGDAFASSTGLYPVNPQAIGVPANGGNSNPSAGGSVGGLPVQGSENMTLYGDKGILNEPSNVTKTDPAGNIFVGGKGSVFGGAADDDGKQLPLVPGKTIGNLDTDSYYVAFRWDYDKTSIETLKKSCVEVYIPNATKKKYFIAKPVDWGPGVMSRNVDVSPAIERDSGISVTDAEVYIRLVPCS